MNRRTFLLAGAAALLIAPSSQAGSAMSGMPGMPGMDHTPDAEMKMSASDLRLREGEPLRDLPRLANTSQTPGVFKAVLTAEPGVAEYVDGLQTQTLAYNGGLPGLLIEADEGDHVEIELRNRIPEQETSIHWHGMPVPADQDGNPMDSIEPGRNRTYSFDLPVGSSGTYWYHPHPHGKTAEQVYHGLAGAFIIKDANDPVPQDYGDTPLFFTDLRIGADGQMPANTMADLMNGRVGDHVLTNGQKNPRLEVSAGTYRRFRLFNATNARFLHLTFGDAPVTIIGTDGGLIEAPTAPVDSLLLVPGERIEIVVAFKSPGQHALKTLAYDRGWMGKGKPDEAGQTLMTVDVSSASLIPASPLPAALRDIAVLGAPVVTRRFEFGEDMSAPGPDMKMAFLINGESFDMTRINVDAKAGQVERWEIVNPTDMDHPFHIHGIQFQIVEHERHGVRSPAPFRAWKDTVNVRPGETARLLLRQDRPGLRMYHCHILEHEQLGMMGIVDFRV
jgi:bilirubin oxidase